MIYLNVQPTRYTICELIGLGKIDLKDRAK